VRKAIYQTRLRPVWIELILSLCKTVYTKK